ncbi:enoyl-CoA hydratase/isomerase family protein [Rhodococcus opacus]|uniref:enoyl-CoA hydratase/isomerase family protein n=1 Tax=Rhodococcus opacus TaxID=37919 RepID=UPI0009B60E86|nr:enoyl-CoA hydratase/isomerase family protein [Rhodococcus opacus]UDG96696.1 enoyl-CoA hydratase/isomerase family protein [Rhodococcus opacus PD630]
MTRPQYDSFTTLTVEDLGRIVIATVDNPPLHLLTRHLVEDLDTFTRHVSADPDALVVVLKSRDPDIFITHNDFANLYRMQPPENPASVGEVGLNHMHEICERLRTMNKITIAQIEGRASGGGAAMVMACDMKFGAIGKAVFNTMSVPIGSVPGGGASQYLPRLVGRSRAIELIMGGLDLDALTAERWGYLNRALPPMEIDDFVSSTARRIATCPAEAVRLTKEVIALADGPIEDGLRQENFRLRRLMASSESLANVERFLAIGGETREGEMRLEALLGDVLSSSMSRTGEDPLAE